MRLIDADALIEAVKQEHFIIPKNMHPYEAVRIQGKSFRKVVDNAPTVDAVEVVRCRDCQNMTVELGLRYCNVWNRFNGAGDDGFCNYGERRTDE